MRPHRALIAAAVMLACAGVAFADDRVPTGTLRATYIATNPVQASVDPATGELRGPGAAIARELARQLGVPVAVTGVASPAAVIDSIKKGAADIGFVAFDPQRAGDVDFSEVYVLAQNTYLVREDSAVRTVADVDRAGITVGVTARDTADLFLTRILKAAELHRNTTGTLETAIAWLADGTVDAYGTNRQRLTELAARHAGYRLLPDNFYGVPQAVITAKSNAALIAAVNAAIDEAKRSGLIARSIEAAGLIGVDVAPPQPRRRSLERRGLAAARASQSPARRRGNTVGAAAPRAAGTRRRFCPRRSCPRRSWGGPHGGCAQRRHAGKSSLPKV
jgi:polar amino acid transport system substrate-binding protein